jgi:peptide/nickel transport system ATP-binding protein
MNDSENILQVRGLCKYFPVYSKGFIRRVDAVVKAVDNVSFDLKASETLGLVGESGCGKTTACRTILRALRPTAGEVWLNEDGERTDLAQLKPSRLRPLRQKMQMIFQDPFSSLNPRMTVGSIIAEPLVIHGIARGKQIKDMVARMLIKVGLRPEHAMRYPHAFSGGQRQRIGIARALIMNPSVVICDEAVSALDVSVQAQVLNLLEDLQREFNLAYLFVAHDLSVVEHICDRVAVMYAGRIVESGKTNEIFSNPRHPYTKALLASVPYPDPDKKIGFTLSGEPVDLAELPCGCSFAPRCREKLDICLQIKPDLIELGNNRAAACHLNSDKKQNNQQKIQETS